MQVISVDELILNAALRSDGAFKGDVLFEEVERLAQEEELNRLTLWNQGRVCFSVWHLTIFLQAL